LIATLSFDNMAAIAAAFASAEGKVTAADVPNFATGGVEMHFAETASVIRDARVQPYCRRAGRHTERARL
jgi:hypothetical protein